MTEVSIPRQEAQRKIEGELPEVRIFNLLSSVGNGENKALELIVMREGVIYSANALYHEVMNHQIKDKAWRMNSNTPFHHCQDSLSPIGLVAKESLSPDDTAWGYEITQFGIRTGVPFAGLLLKWSYEHPEHSLYKMFSSTQSKSIKDEQTLGKKRAQETRYKIFWEIATNPNNRIRLTDIADAINENSMNIRDHLKSLSRNGFISYDATEQGKSSSYFRIKEVVPEQKPKQYMGQKTLSSVVYDLLTHEYLSAEEIVTLLSQKHPEYGSMNRKSLSQNSVAILSHFERQGYLERKKFAYDFRSQLTLSDEQRKTMVSLVTAIDNFKNGDRETIKEGRRFAQRVANDPNLFSELMLKAKDASPSANSTNRGDMDAFLMSILYNHSRISINQIQQFLEEDYDKRLTPKGIHRNLSRLAEKDMIVFEETKSGNVYRVVEDAKN